MTGWVEAAKRLHHKPVAPLVLRITTATQVVYVGPFRTRVEAMVAKVDLEYRSNRPMTIRVMHLPFYAKLTTVAGRG